MCQDFSTCVWELDPWSWCCELYQCWCRVLQCDTERSFKHSADIFTQRDLQSIQRCASGTCTELCLTLWHIRRFTKTLGYLYTSQHLKWIKTFHQSCPKTKMRSCLKTTLMTVEISPRRSPANFLKNGAQVCLGQSKGWTHQISTWLINNSSKQWLKLLAVLYLGDKLFFQASWRSFLLAH